MNTAERLEIERLAALVGDDRCVRPFIDLDSASKDRSDRGRCIIFDMHGLWWSVPTELTIHDVNAAMLDELAHMDVAPFRHDPWKARLSRPAAYPGG